MFGAKKDAATQWLMSGGKSSPLVRFIFGSKDGTLTAPIFFQESLDGWGPTGCIVMQLI